MGSNGSARPVAQHKHIGAVFLAGYPRIREVFDSYREGYLEAHGEHAPLDRLAYLGLCYIGENQREAEEGARKLAVVYGIQQGATGVSNPPGYHPPAVSANVMRGVTDLASQRADPGTADGAR